MPDEVVLRYLGEAEGVRVKRFVLILIYLSLFIYGCDKLSFNSRTADYKLQEMCSKRAKEVFEEVKGSGWNNYSNHYNKKLNKCFIVERGYDALGGLVNVLNDVMRFHSPTIRYGAFLAHSEIPGKVLYCYVENKKCKDWLEWDSLVKPYMEE